MIEEGLQPVADPLIDPLMIVVDANRSIGAGRGGDAFDLAEDAGAACRDRFLNLLLLAVERNFVGAPR